MTSAATPFAAANGVPDAMTQRNAASGLIFTNTSPRPSRRIALEQAFTRESEARPSGQIANGR